MHNADLALQLLNRAQIGLDALKQFAKLVSTISVTWSTLKKLLNRDQRVMLQVQKLRKDLLVIYGDLRETHFTFRERHEILVSDVLSQELAAVLAAVEEACSAESELPKLEMILDKATFIQKCIREQLEASGLVPSAPPLEAVVDMKALQVSFPELSAKSSMVMQALRTDGSDLAAAKHDAMAFAAEAHGTKADVDEYESAAESESDADYVSCDEDAFWRAAQCFFLSGPGMTPISSSKLLGIPVGRKCTAELFDQALQTLGERPAWRKMQNGNYQHGSNRYTATLDRQPGGVVHVNGPQAAAMVLDLRGALDKLQGKARRRSTRRRQPQVVYDKKGRIVKYQDNETMVIDYSGVLEDLKAECDDDL